MKNDEHVLNALRDYHAKHRGLPAFSELSRLSGLAVSTLAGIVNRLKGLGFLSAGDTGRMQPGKRFFERELSNTVRAGLPVPAEDVLPEGLLIDEFLVDTPSRTLLLSVRGDSMIDAGLLPGDIVIVKRGAVVRENDIVVAIVDGDYTVKYFAVDQNRNPYLRPGNENFPNLYPRDELEIFGVVTGSFRRYAKGNPTFLAAPRPNDPPKFSCVNIS